MKNNCIYFVEGKCEAALLAALKEHPARQHLLQQTKTCLPAAGYEFRG